jgi:hypothetical protein
LKSQKLELLLHAIAKFSCLASLLNQGAIYKHLLYFNSDSQPNAAKGLNSKLSADNNCQELDITK